MYRVGISITLPEPAMRQLQSELAMNTKRAGQLMGTIGDILQKRIEESVELRAKNSKRRLSRSYRKFFYRENGRWVVQVGSKKPYAKIQDTGGTITSKGKRMAIPRTPKARQFWPRNFPGKLRALPGSKDILVEDGPVLVPQYVLRRQVRIKGLNYLKPAIKNSKPAIKVALERYLKRSVSVAYSINARKKMSWGT